MHEVAVLAFTYDERSLKYLQSLNLGADVIFAQKIEKPYVRIPAETIGDTMMILPELMNAIIDAEKKGYKAVVTWCHGDPGVKEVREFVNIPVLGPGEYGMHIATMLGHKFSIIVPSLVIKRWIYRKVEEYGFTNKLASIRIINATVNQLLNDSEEFMKTRNENLKTISRTIEECVRAIEEDDTTVIMLGCGGLTWMGDIVAKKLKEKGYDIPLINPLPLTIEFAKALIKFRLKHSGLVYFT
jgi:allantoin racemase